MKVGDLVRWDKDDDIGIVLGFVQADEEDEFSGAFEGNLVISWASYGFVPPLDDTVREWDEHLEVVSESR
tara:strand:+ start:813 stop:1022 length:210 start_codon:yes stop_codon:yes gene_type:complete